LLKGEHAGGWETSFMLAERPELVDPCYRELEEDQPPAFGPLRAIGDTVTGWVERSGRDSAKTAEIAEGLAGGVGWLLNAHFGYGGHTVTYKGTPAIATAEIGHAFREVLAADCLALTEDVVTGRLQAAEVRSLASDAPLIQPNFWRKVWLVAGVVALAVVLL
jgi:creatinine amidohydrolase/Fe(II)-dependent formamide hydrolase-like protein